MRDPIAERVRKVGGTTLRSIGHIDKTPRISDNDADYVEPEVMLKELREDNTTLASRLREAHDLCDEHRDIASASGLSQPDRYYGCGARHRSISSGWVGHWCNGDILFLRPPQGGFQRDCQTDPLPIARDGKERDRISTRTWCAGFSENITG
jgi:hypothetical protein